MVVIRLSKSDLILRSVGRNRRGVMRADLHFKVTSSLWLRVEKGLGNQQEATARQGMNCRRGSRNGEKGGDLKNT